MDELQILANSVLSGAEIPQGQDYDLIWEKISHVVHEMLDHQPDLLFSYLYRLDVDEKLIKSALHPANSFDPHISLAQLILDRQIKRLETRHQYKSQTRKLF